jgi:hypothetical protein
LVLKNYENINEWIGNYEKYDAIGINWKYFGDSGLTKIENNNYSVSRFTKCQVGLNKHIKTIINTKKTKNLNSIHICCHCTNKSLSQSSTISVDGKNYICGPHNSKDLDVCEKIAYLAHFRCKTIEEWNEKCDRNGNGIQSGMEEYRPSVRFKHFQEFNMNDINNTDVADILLGDSNDE